MKYDDAEYYFLDFTTDLPNENGGRHMGLFLEWAILRGLASAELMQEADKLRSGATTGLDLLFDHCDGKLYTDDFNDEGNTFVSACYQHVLPEYVQAMNVGKDATNDEIFGTELTQQRHDRVLWMLDRYYAGWRSNLGMPDKQALSDRVMAIIAPVVQAAGFAAVDGGYGSHSVCSRFERRGVWGSHGVSIVAEDSSFFYGVQVELTVDIDRLCDAIYKEKSDDLGGVSSLQWSATIPFKRFAEGWNSPMQVYDMRSPGFWIFRDEEIEPLAQWLAERLRRFALPLLRGLDGVDAIALTHGTKPITASPLHDPDFDDSYAALLAVEMARHPRLGAFLDETERALRALAKPTPRQQGALELIKRIRTRSRAFLS